MPESNVCRQRKRHKVDSLKSPDIPGREEWAVLCCLFGPGSPPLCHSPSVLVTPHSRFSAVELPSSCHGVECGLFFCQLPRYFLSLRRTFPCACQQFGPNSSPNSSRASSFPVNPSERSLLHRRIQKSH